MTELKRKGAKAEAEIQALYDFCRNVINNVTSNVEANVAPNLNVAMESV